MMRFLLVALAALLAASCKSLDCSTDSSTRQRSVAADTLLRVDSVWVHDSVAVMMRGDTVYKYKERTVYRDRLHLEHRVDSFLRTDTVTTVQHVYDDDARKECARLKLMIAVGILTYLILWAMKNRR